jgi:hypothetical protein
MDKVKLSPEQLHIVIDFIDSRGFHDPGVIVDILDHFACKVEEKLELHPQMTLDEAMATAHYDFGTLGFYPLAAAYEQNTRRKYKTIYRKELKSILGNPLHLISLVLTAILFYKLYLWSYSHLMIWDDINLAYLILFLFYLSAEIFMSFRFTLNNRKNKIAENLLSNNGGFYFFVLIPISTAHPHSLKAIIVIGIISALVMLFLIVTSIARYAALKISKTENDFVCDHLEGKKSHS